MTHRQPQIIWRDNTVPVATRFDDPYYSLENGVGESRHVFLAGNGLPRRFRSGFHIAELGFGTGLNCLVALEAWIGSGLPGPLRFTSFEAFPLASADMEKALAAFAGLRPLAGLLLDMVRRGDTALRIDRLHLDLVVGNANDRLPRWAGHADAWFLDGFAPAKNPDLWNAPLLAEVARHTRPGGTAATYTAAGAVRRNLAAAGFEVQRRPGFGRKRHMIAAALSE